MHQQAKWSSWMLFTHDCDELSMWKMFKDFLHHCVKVVCARGFPFYVTCDCTDCMDPHCPILICWYTWAKKKKKTVESQISPNYVMEQSAKPTTLVIRYDRRKINSNNQQRHWMLRVKNWSTTPFNPGGGGHSTFFQVGGVRPGFLKCGA